MKEEDFRRRIRSRKRWGGIRSRVGKKETGGRGRRRKRRRVGVEVGGLAGRGLGGGYRGGRRE